MTGEEGSGEDEWPGRRVWGGGRSGLGMSMMPHPYRFGSFEIFKTRDPQTGRSGPSVGRMDILNQLLDYTITSFFPEVWCVCSAIYVAPPSIFL